MSIRLLPAIAAGAIGLVLTGGASYAATAELAPQLTASVIADDSADSNQRADFREQALAFVTCLRDNGVALPKPGEAPLSGEDRDTIRAAVHAALAECGDLRPERPERPGDGEGPRADQRDAMRDYAQCLTDEGLELEQLGPRDRGQPRREGDRLDPDQRLERVAEHLGQDATDPAWIAANEVCELPEPMGPRGMWNAPQG